MAQPNMYSSYGAGSNPGDQLDPQIQYQQQSWNQYSAPPTMGAAQPLNSFPPPYFDKNMPPPPYSTGDQRSGSAGWRNNNPSGGGYGSEPRDYTAPSRNDRGSRFDSGSSRPGTGGPGGGRFQRDYSGPTGGNRYGSRDGDSSGGGQVENKRMIFISGLPQTVNENFINDVFSGDCEIDVFDSGRKMIKIYSDRGVPKGECTITYRTEEGAAKIIQMFNGQCFPGSSNIMSISYAKFSGERKSGGRGGFDRGRGSYGGGSDRRDGRDRQNYGGDRDRGGYGDRGNDRGGDRRSGGYGDRGGRSGGSFGDRGGRSGGSFGDRGGFRGGRDSGGHRGGYSSNGGQDRGFGGDRNRDRGSFNDRGGRGGFDRGGRGGRGGGGRDGRPGDWPCSCGNVNFAFRQQCNSCQAPKPGGGDGSSGNSGGPMRGPPRNGGGSSGGDRHRPY